MNDPGTAEPIKQAADEVDPSFNDNDDEKPNENNESEDLEEVRDYEEPNRYWLESTACPLIAGTFGPMATSFSVCALSSSWRVYVPPNGSPNRGITIDDPKWLLAINALSLVVALIANGSLLLNMSKRLKFAIAQPITIIGFGLASGLLIADLAALGSSGYLQLPSSSPAAPPERHALTTAFYYGTMAAAIYAIITALMCFTVWGAYKGHYAESFNLTMAQRSLMLQTMSFFAYLLLGALIFSHIEGWNFLDAVYWADVTLLTVGLGDYTPATHTGRSLFLVYAIGGIIIIGLVIGSIRSLVLERGQKKISARMMEKKRLRAVNSIDPRKHRMRISRFQTIKFVESFTNAAQKREQEFNAMRSVQDCAERDRKWMALGISTTAAFTLWLVGAAIFKVAEKEQGWTYFQSMYFTYTCLLTIGYGDFDPQANSSKAFFVLWSLLAVPTLTILISDMGDTVVQTFSNLTMWVGSLTVLPGENSIRAASKKVIDQISTGKLEPGDEETQEAGHATEGGYSENTSHKELSITDRIADRMARHLEAEELEEALQAEEAGETLDRDIHFYHFILAREVQHLMKDLGSTPPKQYEWDEWEYFLKLMANDYDTESPKRRKQGLVPDELRLPKTRDQWNKKHKEHRWSWLSSKSPLMGYKSETEWILEKLGACLERELRNSRLLPCGQGVKRQPPVSMADMIKRGRMKQRSGKDKEKEGVADDSDQSPV